MTNTPQPKSFRPKEKQEALINGMRPEKNPITDERKIFEKILKIEESDGLYYKIHLWMEEKQAKYKDMYMFVEGNLVRKD